MPQMTEATACAIIQADTSRPYAHKKSTKHCTRKRSEEIKRSEDGKGQNIRVTYGMTNDVDMERVKKMSHRIDPNAMIKGSEQNGRE